MRDQRSAPPFTRGECAESHGNFIRRLFKYAIARHLPLSNHSAGTCFVFQQAVRFQALNELNRHEIDSRQSKRRAGYRRSSRRSIQKWNQAGEKSVNISIGLFRRCFLAGMASLAIGSVAQANILPVEVDQSAEKNMLANSSNRLTGMHATQRLATDAHRHSLSAAKKSVFDDAGKRFEVTYQLLGQLGSVEMTEMAASISEEPASSGLALFQRIVSDESDRHDFLETGILAAVLLLIGGIGYAQHLAKKYREQPKRRPLFPA